MQMRTSKPAAGNKFYITTAKGGLSQCIAGSPTDSACNVLANCVGYACGRFNEIIGEMKYPSLNCNAENFIERAQSVGLTISQKPSVGAIMCWQKGSTLGGGDGAGHVAVVERVDSATQVYTSESGYGSSAFWNQTRNNSNGRWGIGTGYTFRGFIVNPAITDDGDIGYPIERDATHPQIEVTIANLNVRTAKIGETVSTKSPIVGFCKKGFYYTDNRPTVTSDGYKWYNIQGDLWVAKVDGVVEYSAAPAPVDDPKDKIIAELQSNNAKLRAELEAAVQKIAAAKTALS